MNVTQFGSIDRTRLLALVSEAAQETSGNQTPLLYQLISVLKAKNRPEILRDEVLNASIDVIQQDMKSFDRYQIFVFFDLLTKTELLQGSIRLRNAAKSYVDARLPSIDTGALDMASALLKTSDPPAKSCAATWLPAFRKSISDAPSWGALDVLVEMRGLIDSDKYSENAFLQDLALLKKDPETFRINFDRRKARLAKLLGRDQEVLERLVNGGPTLVKRSRLGNNGANAGIDLAINEVHKQMNDSIVGQTIH